MRSTMITALVAILATPLAVTYGADSLTLDDCIEQALKNRASIVMARGAEDLARSGRRAALGAFLPSVSAAYSYSKGETKDQEVTVPVNGWVVTDYEVYVDTIEVDGQEFPVLLQRASDSTYVTDAVSTQPDQTRTNKSYGIGADISLGPATWFNYVASKAKVAQAHLDVIASEQDLIYSVKAAYYTHLAALENITVQEDAVRRSEEQLKLIESRYELGSAALSDVLKQKVLLGNDRLTLLEARNSVTSSRADLAYTIGIDPNSDVEFSTEYTKRGFDGDMPAALEFGQTHQPSLLASQKSVDAARHYLSSARMGYLPQFRGYYDLSWNDGTSGDTIVYNSSSNSWTLGFQVSLNIFDGFSREHNIAQARVNRNNALASYSEQKHLVSLEVKKAYLEIGKTTEAVKVNEENVAAAEEDLRITQEKYNLGAATILDLLNAQVSLKSAQMSRIRSEYDNNLAVAALERAMGKM